MNSKLNDNEIGKRLKDAREKAKLTQYQLEKQTGISSSQISAFENGRKSIGLQSLSKIALATNCTMDEIYFGSPSSKPVNSAINKGELVVNCAVALFYEGVIQYCLIEKENNYQIEPNYFYAMQFGKYCDIIEDMIQRLDDFEKNKDNYPDPQSFKDQIVASAIKQINDRK